MTSAAALRLMRTLPARVVARHVVKRFVLRDGSFYRYNGRADVDDFEKKIDSLHHVRDARRPCRRSKVRTNGALLSVFEAEILSQCRSHE